MHKYAKLISYRKWSYPKKLMAKLKLDLHDIYNKGDKIEAELQRIMDEAVEKKIALVEIIPGIGHLPIQKV